MAIGGPPSCSRTQAASHRTSTGQTRAHVPPRMFSSKIVAAAASGSPLCDLRDEAGDVDFGGTGDRARRGGVGPAALEAPVRLDERLGRCERRPQLVEVELWLRRCAHTASVRAAGCIAIRACP